jgi:hypothetical protein
MAVPVGFVIRADRLGAEGCPEPRFGRPAMLAWS